MFPDTCTMYTCVTVVLLFGQIAAVWGLIVAHEMTMTSCIEWDVAFAT